MNQQYFVCDWWFNVDCSLAETLYSLNDEVAAERESYAGKTDDGGAYQGDAGQEQTVEARRPGQGQTRTSTGELVQEARENTEEQEPGEPLEEETLLLSGPEAEEEPREGAVEEEVRGQNQDTWHQALMKTTRMMSPLMWVTELQGVTRTTLRGAGTSLC